jgi:hypothetical protein
MNKFEKELIESILDEHARCKDDPELEAKSLFRLLNYCPPDLTREADEAPVNALDYPRTLPQGSL